MLEKLMQNPYAWLFLSILTVVSFVFAIYTWFAGKKRKELSVSCKSDIIVKSGKCPINKLKLSFDGRAIHDLTSSKFYIWNSGNDIINAADIVESRPISIINMDSTLILDAQILRETEPTNAFSISTIDTNKLQFAFDYLDRGEGILVQVLHTGDARNLMLDGKIKGGKEIRKCDLPVKKKFVLIRVLGKCVLSFFLFSIFTIIINYTCPELYASNDSLTVVLVGLIVAVGSSLFNFISELYGEFFNRSIPLELRDGKSE